MLFLGFCPLLYQKKNTILIKVYIHKYNAAIV